MSTSPTHFMQEALKVATEGLEKGELPIGAVVVLDGQIIARAHTAEIAEQRMLVHAELLALLKADTCKFWNSGVFRGFGESARSLVRLQHFWTVVC